MSIDTKEVITIDGSKGEGGGQIFRTSLSLAMCLGQPVRIEKIRAGRNRPGLLRQHMVCLKAAQEICDAKVSGAELGSSSVTFIPGTIKAGQYRFAIGSAGSTTLVFQTVLMPLLLADDESELYIEGGTHNGMAPSYDFIQQSFLPQMVKMGCRIETELESYGFYPAGGGAWKARVYPLQEKRSLHLMECGELRRQSAVATSSRIPAHVAKRELSMVQKKLLWPEASLHERQVQSSGPGNLVSLRIEMDNVTEVCESIGERNVSAERVAGRAIRDLKRYQSAAVPVGEYLADQLLLPMALGRGGRFRTLNPSQHLLTNIEVIKQLTSVDFQLTRLDEDCWEVAVIV